METTLYDRNGHPTAYIADDNETIYLWNGHVVAYLCDDKVYGFNGQHLGWFVDGVVRDQSGAKIGFVGEKCPSVKHVSPVKSVKHVKHVKNVRHIAHIRPILKIGYSDEDFERFLENGA